MKELNMSKNTQGYILYNMMKAAGDKGVTKTQIAQKLGVKESSIGIYLFGLRKFFNAEFDTVKQGRKVISYKLVNADKIQVRATRKGSKTATVKTSAPMVKPVKSAKVDKAVAPDADLHVAEISDREFSDIKSSLGLM
jgi:hypothetical protein